jgi:thiol-disulfide isomerase/thioredoxin
MRPAFVLFVLLVGQSGQAQEAATPWIGIGIAAGDKGVLVNQVLEATPAQRAGIQVGDQVVAIDGAAVARPEDLIGRVQQKGVGAKVALGVWRGGKVQTVSLALEARPDEVQLLREHLIGHPAPAFALAEAKGPFPATLRSLSGHVVLVEFWATWCGPCVASQPRLIAWQQKYGPRGLRIVGVSEEPLETIARHAEAHKVAYTVAHDPGTVNEAYRIPAIPTLVVIDQKGIVRYADVGAGDKLDAAERVIDELLGHAAPN